MAFQKGHQKIGGRKKGTTNLDREVPREVIERLLGRSMFEELLGIMQQVRDPLEHAKMLRDLMPYCYPKLQAMTIDANIQVEAKEVVKSLAAKYRIVEADKL